MESKGILEECIHCKDPGTPKQQWTTKGLITVGITGTLFIGSYALTIPFISPAFRKICLPYLPATPKQIQNVLSALKHRTGSLIDIGSGDGRIVIEASKNGFRSYGVELNYWLVLYSRCSAWWQKQSSAKFFKKDLWKTDLSMYDNIVIFGAETMMGKLEKKFYDEVNKDSRVIVCRFPLPNWQPIKVIGTNLDTVWVYMHPNNMEYDTCKLPKDIALSSLHLSPDNYSTLDKIDKSVIGEH